MIKLRSLLAISILSLLGLSGCARYKAKPLNKLFTNTSKQHTHQCICFNHYAFTRSDCKTHLDRNVIAEGYQPVQIEITNNSNHSLRLSADSFPFPIASPETIARLVHTDTVGRSVGYGVLGFFMWPFIIPAIVDGIGSAEANEALDDDFAQKSLRASHIIQPNSSVNGLIFVPVNEFYEDFSFTLVDTENNKKYVLSAAKPKVMVVSHIVG